jgi:hypothetical protein
MTSLLLLWLDAWRYHYAYHDNVLCISYIQCDEGIFDFNLNVEIRVMNERKHPFNGEFTEVYISLLL